MKSVLILLAASSQLVSPSSLLVDWSSTTIPESIAYVLDYAPAVGNPLAGTSLGSSARRALITDTIPACEYTIYLSAIMPDGKRKHVAKKTMHSSPEAPVLDSIETNNHEAIVSYFPPKESNISFHIEYYPKDEPEYANAIDTKASLVRLRGLYSGTTFRINIKSVYNGVLSTDSIESTFRTTGTMDYDHSRSAEAFSVRTLPPGFNLETTTTFVLSNFAAAQETEKQEQTKDHVASSAATGSFQKLEDVSGNTTTTSAYLQTTSHQFSSTISRTTSTSTVSAAEDSATSQIHVKAPIATSAQEIPSLDDMLRELGEASWISISDDGHLMRLNWTLPESALCDAFLVNYTVTTLTRPKSFSIATADDFSLIKFFANHTLDMRVFCMIAGSLSKTWWAHRVVHLTNPMPVRGARVTSSTTDEFYVSRITIDWEWPPHNDFDLFEIVVSYGIEERSMVEIAVSTVEPIVISDLEPAQRYRIAIRNQSVELGLKSSAVELTQITAPIISSTVFPGKISSTSININFGESDVEQGRFDYYELVFAGNNKNITKRIDINQEKSLTFTNLIPGKTYVFALSTVYKGQRSRTVTESVTTYPLKVNALYPVIGREYVVLYWDVENFADSNCRFRLSYNAERVSTVTVDLRDVSRHRFSGLLPDVFYTFTITVVMGAGNSTAESESEMVTVYVPKGRLTPSLKRQGSRELIVKFENDENVFSPLNGAIDSVAVIVSDDTSMNDDYYELRSWSEVSTNENWGAYRASPSMWNPFSKGARDATFTIGDDDCVRQSLDEPYCNGILRANGPYKVKLRAYTNTNAAMESDWIAIDGTEEEVKEEEKKNQRRFPCHMYINGCPWESNANHESSVAVLLLTWLALL